MTQQIGLGIKLPFVGITAYPGLRLNSKGRLFAKIVPIEFNFTKETNFEISSWDEGDILFEKEEPKPFGEIFLKDENVDVSDYEIVLLIIEFLQDEKSMVGVTLERDRIVFQIDSDEKKVFLYAF